MGMIGKDKKTAVNLFVTGRWTSNLGVSGDNNITLNDLTISFEVYKWIFAACILLSFVLLAWDLKKAAAIIKSRDISYAFTSMIAYRYYAIQSYAHFCLFEKIQNSKKQIDEVAFFCFFTFRGWKRLMFADGPRQVINGIILITVVTKNNQNRTGGIDLEFWNYENFGTMNSITISLMIFTLTLWIISVLLMIAAVFCYIPLVIHIKGNLKEYCCHKIDKRIDEIIRKKAKQRGKDAKNTKKGDPLQKPTLPKIGLMEEGGMPMSTPRMGAQSPYLTAGSPAVRKNMPMTNDPYRHQRQPPRPYTPQLDDDSDTRPLRLDNHQQAYHNRNYHQQHDYRDDRSEISDSSSYRAGGGYPGHQYPPSSHQMGHRRQGSETSTVLSGSNQGSVVGGYGPRVARHPLHQGHHAPYSDTVMMNDLGQRKTPNPNGGYL
ncbi:hypothetical protein BGZ76_003427 [Entomortierella beljakovae]|nr:hypothetical protein BGZ76_003427 [Entomortierella beljakovae]